MKEIDYKSTLENYKYTRDILKNLAMADGLIQFTELRRRLEEKYKKKDEEKKDQKKKGMHSTLHYNLDILEKERIIIRFGEKKRMRNGEQVSVKGLVKLNYKTPLCYIFDSPGVPYAYLGLLGKRDTRTEPETETAIELLKKQRINFKSVTVVTTHRAAAEWEDKAPKINCWQLLKDEEVSEFETIEDRVEAIIPNLMRDYILIMDCTSATKPATLAFYEVAKKHKIPLIYIYESEKKLTWITKKEDLVKELGIENSAIKETVQTIDYKSALENDIKRAILTKLAKAGGKIQKSELKKSIEISESPLNRILTILKIKDRIITLEDDTIKLNYKTPLCYIFNSPKAPYAYLGLLGLKNHRTESETETAIKLLEKQGFKFESVTVATTKKGIEQWKDTVPKYFEERKTTFEWHQIGDQEISNVQNVESQVKAKILELMRDYILIMDCTSATVPATIAYYKLAIKHQIPLTYVYVYEEKEKEKENKLTWIISKEDLSKKLAPQRR